MTLPRRRVDRQAAYYSDLALHVMLHTSLVLVALLGTNGDVHYLTLG